MSCSLILTQDHEGRRLDRTLRSIWPAVPLSAVMKALRKGEVRLDSVRAHEPGARVHAGQELHVPWEPPGERPVKKNYGSVPVLWRGECAMMIDKPAGLLVQPDVKDGDSVITRVRGMTAHGEKKSSPAAVHRLDRNTTGVLAVALRGDALRELERLFKERLVKKYYLAVVVGHAPDFVEIDAPLLKDAEANTVRVSHDSVDAKKARTLCRRLTGDREFSLVRVELLTGRTHQARVHLAHIGHPVLGDRKYGDFKVNRLRQRQEDGRVHRPLLHAFELSFPDGLKGGPLHELDGRTFRAPLPLDMRTLIARRGWPYEKFINL